MATVASATAGYVWEDPGDSIMIQVGMDLVERLGTAVRQGLGTGGRGTEIGGLLLGRTPAAFARTVVVEDFELMPCEHLRGASYTLSADDRLLISRRLSRQGARQVVGYFRSHTRPGMYLDQDDYAVFSRYFPEPSQVFLLVKPAADGPAMGGFFFWEDGELNRRAPYRQFPFDSALLAAEGFPIAAGPPPARPMPQAVPKPVVQAPRRRLHVPAISWIVVPLIAAIFLVAALIVSETRSSKPEVARSQNAPPAGTVEPLLPQPVPSVAPPPIAAVPVLEQPKPSPMPKPAPRVFKPAPARTVPVAHPTPQPVEPPPALATPAVKSIPAPLLPRVTTAPPPAIEMSYEPAHAGVFHRAFHKIAGESDEPAVPVRKVAPSGATANGEVDVKVSIDENGSVTRAQLLTKGSEVGDAALAAARQWRFTPARRHDKPIASEMILHFRSY